jgi:hypothetical protein
MRIRHSNTVIAACAALMFAALPVPAVAQDAAGGAPGEWLSRYASARTLGLGG